MRYPKPSANITIMKSKYRQSIGRNKEFINWRD